MAVLLNYNITPYSATNNTSQDYTLCSHMLFKWSSVVSTLLLSLSWNVAKLQSPKFWRERVGTLWKILTSSHVMVHRSVSIYCGLWSQKIMHTTNRHTSALIVLHNAITLKITEILNVRILHMTKQHKTQEAYRLGRGTMPESGQQQKTMHHKQNNSIRNCLLSKCIKLARIHTSLTGC